MLYLDLDGLKRVNDRDGHAAGDAVLVDVAHRLRVSIPREAGAARLSGDEFAVVLPALASPADAAGIASRLLAGVRSSSVSIGVATATTGAAEADDLCRRADRALLAAKRAGGGQVAVSDPAGAVGVAGTPAVPSTEAPGPEPGVVAVPPAPVRRRLVARSVHDLATGTVQRVEVRLRVVDETGRSSAPVAAVRHAEASGRLDELTAWVLDGALAARRSWREPGTVPVSVRLAAGQVAEPTVVRGVLTAVRSHGVPGSGLALEVHTDQRPPSGLVGAVDLLRERGVTVVLVDVERAWALEDIVRYRPAEVTVGHGLVRRLPADPVARATLRGVLAVAHAVGAAVTATGVQTRDEWHAVVSSGVDRAQGRYVDAEWDLADAPTADAVWRASYLTMRDGGQSVLTAVPPVGTVHSCTPAFSYAERAFAENQRPRDPSSPAGPGGFLCPRGHFDAAEES